MGARRSKRVETFQSPEFNTRHRAVPSEPLGWHGLLRQAGGFANRAANTNHTQ
jgi:hypothetical protein